MKELRSTIEILKDRVYKNKDEYLNMDLSYDVFFLIEKQDEYIKKLENLITLVSKIDDWY